MLKNFFDFSDYKILGSVLVSALIPKQCVIGLNHLSLGYFSQHTAGPTLMDTWSHQLGN